ncbi:glutathione S-transferase U23 [Cryptomeria japonica]|uniref:glutathione S-transferase U23 n=1 Tax=Cryptomeria japonica TaxID=3369 RepID=UPI0025AC848F|nr:glutathione S-transferase U23 [Cryptomeria japonica]
MDNLKEDREDVKLLTYWFSPYGMRVMIGLEEKGISYEYVEDDLRPGNKSPMLLQMNPIHKKVPVLIHNGSPISESLIVLQYIDNVWNSPHNAFLPSHPYDRAIALFWTDFVDQKVCTPVNQIVKTKGEIQEAAKCDFLQNLAILEGELKGKKYFGGDRFGLVDIAFVPFTSWFDAVESLGRLKIDLEEKFPNIWAWKKRCLERESVKKTLLPPEKVLVVASELRKAKLGETCNFNLIKKII